MDAGLDQSVIEWIEATTKGRITRLDRALARREAWIVDIARPDASPLECFVRVAHPGDPANSSEALEKETVLARALGETAVPLPAVVAVNPQPHTVIFERIPGRSDLHQTSAAQQDAVYRHHLEILGELHRLDPKQLDLGGMDAPDDALACAMSEVDALEARIAGLGPQPIARFGARWLRRHAPKHVERVALLHGDAGISNFLFEDSRVNAVIDWEWAHLGDPMEDLGSICIHASFSPSGAWPSLLAHYERTSGIPVELDKVFYYRVHNLARSVLALAPIRARLDPRDPVALNLCFALHCDRMLCEAIAEATGVELDPPSVPEMPTGTDVYSVLVENLRQDVAPHVVGEFPTERLRHATVLAQMLHRQHELADWWREEERKDLEAVLGQRPSDLPSGRAALDERIDKEEGLDEAELLRALWRISSRAQWVAEPVAKLFGEARLRPIV